MTQIESLWSQQEIELNFQLEENPSEFLPACRKCGLDKHCQNPRMDYDGKGKRKILIVNEFCTGGDDLENKPFTGIRGRFWKDELEKHGLDLREDFWIYNAVSCYALNEYGEFRFPTSAETLACKPRLDKLIYELKPKQIWLLGENSVRSFLLGDFSNFDINIWRGLSIPDQKTKAWVVPLYTPTNKEINEDELNKLATFRHDLERAVKEIDKEGFEVKNYAGNIEIITDYALLSSLLNRENSRGGGVFVFDYEANRLKPHKGGRIVSASFATTTSTAFSFPLDYRDHFNNKELTELEEKFKAILTNPNIKKIAQNVAFERSWSRVVLNVDPNPIEWDTILGSHNYDCRQRYTNLNMQTYLHFGVRPYDKQTKQYLKSSGDDGFNKIDDCPLDELLLYGGYDSLYEIMLYYKQQELYNKEPEHRMSAYNLLHNGMIALSDVSHEGIPANIDHYKKEDKIIKKKLIALEDVILESKEAKDYKEVFGKPLKWNSDKEMGHLIYDERLLAQPLPHDGKRVTDKEVLGSLKGTFAKNVLEWRKLHKISGTYIGQFIREYHEGRIHPFFDLYIPITYRSSSSMPNFQNIPVRDEMARMVCRSGLIASPGYFLMENDFKGVEVSTAAMITGDESLKKYVSDKSKDMHRDTAMDLLILPAGEITEPIRFAAKNDWVFAEFYGSTYHNCAPNFWNSVIKLKTKDGTPVREHLRQNNIKNLQNFLDFAKEIEYNFWHNRFNTYRIWKEEINEEFRRNGYIETPLGFRYSGLLSFNEVSNYPIQGTAFHLLLSTLILMMDFIKEEKLKTRIIGQVHDCLLNNVYPPEIKIYLSRLLEVVEVDLPQAYDFINVPLVIETEVAGIDESWADIKEANVQELLAA